MSILKLVRTRSVEDGEGRLGDRPLEAAEDEGKLCFVRQNHLAREGHDPPVASLLARGHTNDGETHVADS